MDAIGISLEVDYIDGHANVDSHRIPDHDESIHETAWYYGMTPEWNYDLHGSDWPDKYPNCVDQF